MPIYPRYRSITIAIIRDALRQFNKKNEQLKIYVSRQTECHHHGGWKCRGKCRRSFPFRFESRRVPFFLPFNWNIVPVISTFSIKV